MLGYKRLSLEKREKIYLFNQNGKTVVEIRVNLCKGTKRDIGFFAMLYAVKKIIILASTEITIKLGSNFGR